LKKNILSVSYMIGVYWRVVFDGQNCIIIDCSSAGMNTLSRGVGEGGFYKLLVDLVEHVHSNESLDEPFRVEES
jgi:hypothetical protein